MTQGLLVCAIHLTNARGKWIDFSQNCEQSIQNVKDVLWEKIKGSPVFWTCQIQGTQRMISVKN